MNSLETDDFSEVRDFIHEQCMQGHNCELTDMETGDINFIYADEYIREFEEV